VPLTFDIVAAAAPASSMVTPGILGFLVFAALAVALVFLLKSMNKLVFLLKSMNKQFRKIAPEPGPPGGTGDPDETGTGAPAGGQEIKDPARTPE
jgi:hypothetical protein